MILGMSGDEYELEICLDEGEYFVDEMKAGISNIQAKISVDNIKSALAHFKNAYDDLISSIDPCKYYFEKGVEDIMSEYENFKYLFDHPWIEVADIAGRVIWHYSDIANDVTGIFH